MGSLGIWTWGAQGNIWLGLEILLAKEISVGYAGWADGLSTKELAHTALGTQESGHLDCVTPAPKTPED